MSILRTEEGWVLWWRWAEAVPGWAGSWVAGEVRSLRGIGKEIQLIVAVEETPFSCECDST
jgi:hypothetical protein